MAEHFRTQFVLRPTLLVFLLAAAGPQTVVAQAGKAADAKCKTGSKDAACKGKPSGDPMPAQDSSQTGTPAGAAFPFPTGDSQGTERQADAPAAGTNVLPAMPTGDVPDPPASSERPMRLPPGYPGSSSSSGADDGPDSSRGSSSSRASDDDDVAPTTAAPDAPVRSSALKDLGSRGDLSEARAKLEQTRITDDLRVGSFYMKDGNTQGAYMRFKDATDHAPDDPDAHFNLAEAAGRLNKHDEAVLNYQEYIRLDAGGDHDKASRKALAKLGITAH